MINRVKNQNYKEDRNVFAVNWNHFCIIGLFFFEKLQIKLRNVYEDLTHISKFFNINYKWLFS